MEVQNHGVLFEDTIIRKITGISKSEYQKLLEGAYTATTDITKGILSDIDYSIKVSKSGTSIGCGDLMRFLTHVKNKDLTMIVGEWVQIGDIKRYNVIYEFDIKPKHYKELFANIDENALAPFIDYVKSIPPGLKGQTDNKDLWKLKRNEIYSNYGRGLVRIDAKIDSKNQRRTQGSINLEDLLNSTIIHRKYDKEYREIKLPYDQNSAPRSF